MFDEGRWFGRGATLDVWTTPGGWRTGVLICEDLWHPALSEAERDGVSELVVAIGDFRAAMEQA